MFISGKCPKESVQITNITPMRGEGVHLVSANFSTDSYILQTLVLNNEFIYASKNPGVFTDSRCYQLHALDAQCALHMLHMHWVAVQVPSTRRRCHKAISCQHPALRVGGGRMTLKSRVKTDHFIRKKRFIPCNKKLQPSKTA